MSKSFKKSIEIKETDYDQMGHVNNVVYLQWVQDIAEAHWHHLSGSIQLSDYLWVAIRHEIDYLKEIKPGEQIMAETYVKKMEGVKSERWTIISTKESGQIKARAKTIWCLLDANSKRPKRIPHDLKELFL
ncbi:acyl-CoA thioesterase [Marivirga sp. S37H4]|uniref:Acyl-CoA thioesterase n=1 Tax=Marivirga aurantiaca TaxID=2802615 RepID=A0A934WX01_9BACT|nr:acyl-CoA thioesterase [Marivirga aurantiaca]MBK6264406.1 acyl-CoA thioesterase [Marivirga aurantiaca]